MLAIRVIAYKPSVGHHGAVGSVERFAAFRRAVLSEPRLEARLQPIDEWPAFIDAAIAIASEEGIELTADDVAAAREESRRSWREQWV
jgi:hypothetical protein